MSKDPTLTDLILAIAKILIHVCGQKQSAEYTRLLNERWFVNTRIFETRAFYLLAQEIRKASARCPETMPRAVKDQRDSN